MDSKLTATVLKQIDVLEQELAKLKKDIIHSLVVKEKPRSPLCLAVLRVKI